jgi:hypothetical protein
MGRKPQIDALKNPEPYNAETAELLSWFDVELKRRGFEKPERELVYVAN